MPKTNELLLKLEGFNYTTSPFLQNGILLDPKKNASNIRTITLPWVKYYYQHLPMVVINKIYLNRK